MRLRAFLLFAMLVFSACATMPTNKDVKLVDFPERYVFIQAIQEIGRANDIDTSPLKLFWYDGYSLMVTADDEILVGSAFLQKYRLRYGAPEQIYCFVAHELAHYKLGHIGKRQAASYGVTALMMGLGMIVPGAGLLNWGVNPMVTSGYSRSQELEADTMAVKFLDRQGMEQARDKYIAALRWIYQGSTPQSGIMATHPALEDRVKNLEQGK